MQFWIHWVYIGVVSTAAVGVVGLASRRLVQLRHPGNRPTRARAINELIWTLVPLLLLVALACRAWRLPSGW